MRRERGFTLVEGMVSTFIFALLIAIVIGFLVPTNQAATRVRNEAQLIDQSRAAMARIEKDALNACALEASSSGTVAVFRLNRYSSNGDILANQYDNVTYSASGRVLRYSRGSISQTLLGDLDSTVTPFSYFGATLQSASPSSACLIRVALQAKQRANHGQVVSLQTRDFRLRNAP
ncbi:MAG TPA: prepilin-type N-terminal cleavage/methylation domain-containing protein [Chroococcales cyanobacterium]|jgi:type II secretory pathway component PulJ